MDVHYIERLTTLFQNELGPEKSKWMIDQFNRQKSIEEMFTCLWDLEEAHRYLTPTLVPSGKSDAKADKLRTEGDNYHTQGNLDKALELYNQSIMTARHPALPQCDEQDKINNNETNVKTDDYKTLALGYASRSAVLLDLEQYEKCMSDIELALAYGCSQSLQLNLEERRMRCMAAQNERETAINGDHQKDEEVDFDDPYSMLDKCNEVSNEAVTSREILESLPKNRKLPKVAESHPNIPALSSAVKLAYSPSMGRHIIADRDIYPGEVVGKEKAYCSSIYWEDLHTHCSTCWVECLTPLPCANCSNVIFCSEECRTQSLSAVHFQECRILPTLATLEIKDNIITHIAFRLILQTTYTTLRDTLPILRKEAEERDSITLGFDDDGFYSSTEYRPIYHLVTNKDQRPSQEMYEMCVMAFVMTKLLVQGDLFFKDDLGRPVIPTREDLLMVGEILVHHMLNIFCNAFQLSDMKLTAAPVKTILRVFGEGVFPALSLFNHSCNPTVRHYNHGDHMVLRAVRFIPAGKEVTTTYCGSFYKEDAQERREHLLNSYIDCTCDACLLRWPVTSGLPMKMKVKCTACFRPVSNVSQFPRCPSCMLNYGTSDHDEDKSILVDKWWTTVEDLQLAQQEVQFILLRKKSGQHVMPEDFQILCNFVELLEKQVELPCQSFCYAVDTLFLIFCLQFCSSSSDSTLSSL